MQALLCWQALHVALLTLTGGYVIARVARGLLASDRRGTLDHARLMWHYACVQGLVMLALVHALRLASLP
jgi:cytochrome c oxidase subunit I+III